MASWIPFWRSPHSSEDASPRIPFWRRWFGTRSERAADRFLRGLGYRILARNFTCGLGELDRVVRDGSTIVFVEVRSTESANPAHPANSVDAAKQRRLTQLALYFLQKKRLLKHPARFDVILVTWPASQAQPAIIHLKNAFEASGRGQMFS